MPSQTAPSADTFNWAPQPEAAALLHRIVAEFLDRCDDAANLARRMRDETGTRFFDWIDSITLPASQQAEEELTRAGFTLRPASGASRCFVQEKGMFPRVVLAGQKQMQVAIKVDSAADFLAVWQAPPDVPVEGMPLAPLRRARVFAREAAELWVVERHGYRGFSTPQWDASQSMLVLRHAESFRRRGRDFPDDEDGFRHAESLIASAIADLGVGYATDLFFAAEREYWQRRNRAAQAQKRRQDQLGLGWANHDHHTYRSSRQHFTRLIALLEQLGFVCRERFYAGADAEWGAQVLEQPEAQIVIFADVDLAPDEVLNDFAHEPLPDRKELGTVGLWCALHGEAMLQAGMHHLECQFEFDALREQLAAQEGIATMNPFTDLAHLRQAFTEGERWPVRPERISRLLADGRITEEQAAIFAKEGALGSHLENLERHDGFKGFNQKGISEILSRTDPRRTAAAISSAAPREQSAHR